MGSILELNSIQFVYLVPITILKVIGCLKDSEYKLINCNNDLIILILIYII